MICGGVCPTTLFCHLQCSLSDDFFPAAAQFDWGEVVTTDFLDWCAKKGHTFVKSEGHKSVTANE